MDSRRNAAALGLIAAAIGLYSCGGASSSPSAPALSSPSPAAPGSASSLNMVLRANLNLAALGATAGSGDWGYTSPSGRRLALVGTSIGLSVVDVTNPSSPRITGTIVGGSSAWREVRTYREYAYVTTEAKTGLDIVDLHDPDRPVRVRTWSDTFTSAHSLSIDEERGLLYANGTSNGMHVLDLADPTNPRELGLFTGFYVHESYERGNLLYAAAIRDGFLATLDASHPDALRELSRFTTGGSFTHNSWPTRDGRYLFTTDERAGAPIEGWDLLGSPSPRKVSEYIAAPGTIPHNVMIDEDRLVLSHYTEGVRLLNVRDPEHPTVLGFYDTYLGASTGFSGAWGAYIFPRTNLIVVSDINGGLFVVEYTGS
jgi:choice-of-anchor B domain-containing protein